MSARRKITAKCDTCGTDWVTGHDCTSAERARELFERRYYVDPDSSIIGDAVNHSAIQLLKDDPEEYFRLARIWRSVGDET